MRHLPRLSPAAWKTLARAVLKEPAGSAARVSLASAALVHAPAGLKASFRTELLRDLRTGTNGEQYEACAAFARVGGDDDVPQLRGLLGATDPDVRVGAAYAILSIGLRNRHSL